MVEVTPNNNMNSSARAYLFGALDRMNKSVKMNNESMLKAFTTTVEKAKTVERTTLEPITSEIKSNYISRDDLMTVKKEKLSEKLQDKIIYLQTKMEMKSTKEERTSYRLGIERALSADISEEGQKQYRINQFNQIIEEFEFVIKSKNFDETTIRNLYYKVKTLESRLQYLEIKRDTYKACMLHIANIRKRLVEKLFDIKLEQVKEYQIQKQKTRKN